MADLHPPQSRLEQRIRHYELLEDRDDPLRMADWLALGLTGIAFPALCLVVGWLVGW
jgi:hypothetical protein